MSETNPVTGADAVEQRILLIRGQKVILDVDLAEVYGVATARLNEQVKRNRARFPVDFVFKLSATEKAEVVANCDILSKVKYSRTLPNAFTEHGAIMAASVLNSSRAIEMSVFVVRAFVHLRRQIMQNRELARRFDELERVLGTHDRQIVSLVEAIRQLMSSDKVPAQRRIGFGIEDSYTDESV